MSDHDESEHDKEVDEGLKAMEEVLRGAGIDPDTLKARLIDVISKHKALVSVTDEQARCVAQMAEGILPGPFTIVFDNGGDITAIGNEPQTVQCMLALGYVFMFMNAHPDQVEHMRGMIRTGMHGSETVREAFTLGLDH